MSEIFRHFEPGQIIGLVAVGGGLLIPIFAVLGGVWNRGRLTALKREMVERGMSADEIHAVLTAGDEALSLAGAGAAFKSGLTGPVAGVSIGCES